MILRRIARPMLASIFIAGGIDALRNPSQKAGAAQPGLDQALAMLPNSVTDRLPDNPEALVRINAALYRSAPIALLAVGKAPRVASLVLAGTLVPTTVAGHDFLERRRSPTRAMQRTQFLKNVSLLGGLLIAAADTESRRWGGVDAVPLGTLRRRSPRCCPVTDSKDALGDGLQAVGERVPRPDRGRRRTSPTPPAARAAISSKSRRTAPRTSPNPRGSEGAVLAEIARERAAELAEIAAERGAELAEVARERGPEFADSARDRGGPLVGIGARTRGRMGPRRRGTGRPAEPGGAREGRGGARTATPEGLLKAGWFCEAPRTALDFSGNSVDAHTMRGTAQPRGDPCRPTACPTLITSVSRLTCQCCTGTSTRCANGADAARSRAARSRRHAAGTQRARVVHARCTPRTSRSTTPLSTALVLRPSSSVRDDGIDGSATGDIDAGNSNGLDDTEVQVHRPARNPRRGRLPSRYCWTGGHRWRGRSYLATPAAPEGVIRRRHIRSRGRTVTALNDEYLDLDVAQAHGTTTPAGGVAGESALLAARTPGTPVESHDIVATIQSEQDAIIGPSTRASWSSRAVLAW